MSDNKNKKSSQRGRGPKGRGGKKAPLPSYRTGPFSWLIIAIVIFTAMMMLQQWQSVEEVRLDEFINHIQSKHVESVTVKDTEIIGKFNESGIASRGGKGKVAFVVYYKPEVDGECVLERGSGLEPGELVCCVVTGTEGADLLVAPREVLPRRAADPAADLAVVGAR